jgi:hypothetical protein
MTLRAVLSAFDYEESQHITLRAAKARAESCTYFQYEGVDSTLIDELITEHDGHYPNFIRECRLCIYRATMSMYIGNRNADFAKAFLANISTETRHSIVLEIARLLSGSNGSLAKGAGRQESRRIVAPGNNC